MGLDLSNVQFSDVASVLALVGTVASFLTKPGAKALEKVQDLEERLAVVEAEMSHLPDKETAHRMELGLTRLEGRIDALGEKLKPFAAISDRLQDFLLDQAKR